jgi:hypothetical protein
MINNMLINKFNNILMINNNNHYKIIFNMNKILEYYVVVYFI